jgi:hypothetical protein
LFAVAYWQLQVPLIPRVSADLHDLPASFPTQVPEQALFLFVQVDDGGRGVPSAILTHGTE